MSAERKTIYVHPDLLWKVRLATWLLAAEGYELPDVQASSFVPAGQAFIIREPPITWPAPSAERNEPAPTWVPLDKSEAPKP